MVARHPQRHALADVENGDKRPALGYVLSSCGRDDGHFFGGAKAAMAEPSLCLLLGAPEMVSFLLVSLSLPLIPAASMAS